MSFMILYTRLKTVILILVVLSLHAWIFAAPQPEISQKRMQKISKIITKYKEAGENLSDSDVQQAVIKEVAELYKLEPEAKKNSKSTQEIGKVVREKVSLKFPDNYDMLKKKAEEEAEKNFQMAKVLDYVQIKYNKGDKTFEAEGYFFNYGTAGQSVNIGGNIISLFDLVPDDRVKFDPAFRNQKKDSYIQTKIRDYYSRKNAYSVSIYQELRQEVIKENEDNGYIFAWNEWRNPKEVALMLVKDIQAAGDKKTTEQSVEVADVPDKNPVDKKTKKDPGTPIVDTTKEVPDTTPALPKEKVDKKREALVKKAEEKKLEISSKYAGIDADQGYELASWEIKHDEMAILYPQFVKGAAGSEIESIAFEKGPVQKIEFYFAYGVFYKVVFDFRIGPPEGMLALGRRLRDKYGLTDDEKAAPEPETPVPQVEPCTGEHEWDDAGKCKKCGITQAELEVPQEQNYVWTGKITKGTLAIRLNPEKTTYTEFVLTKEAPGIKEKLTAEAERKKQEEEEAKKKKLIEDYNKYK